MDYGLGVETGWLFGILVVIVTVLLFTVRIAVWAFNMIIMLWSGKEVGMVIEI